MGDGKKAPEERQGMFGKIWERFGEVAKRLGLIGDADVQAALDAQEKTQPRKRIGEILIDGGKLSADHVEQVLKHQKIPPAAAAQPEKPARKAPAAKPAKKKAPAAKSKARPKKAPKAKKK